MASPTAPTLTSLATEALARAGYSSPTPARLTRAEDQFMEEIKNDIFIDAPKMKSLHITAILIVVNGKSRYAMPTDYSANMTLGLLFGDITNTAQAGSSGTVTLAAAETLDEDFIIGKDILITAGTAKGSMSQCIGYNSTTKVATVSPDFTLTPDGTSVYMIVETNKELDPDPVWVLDKEISILTRGEPVKFYPIGDADNGEFILELIPYRTDGKLYGLQCRYYANLMKLDLAGTLIATLYQRWRNVWLQGVYAKQLMLDDDERAGRAEGTYRALITELKSREVYGMDFSELQMTVDERWP